MCCTRHVYYLFGHDKKERSQIKIFKEDKKFRLLKNIQRFKRNVLLGMVAHACNLSTPKAKQERKAFKASLG